MRNRILSLLAVLALLLGVGVLATASPAAAYPGYTKSITCVDAQRNPNSSGGTVYGYPVTFTLTWETEVGHPANVRPRLNTVTLNNPPSRAGAGIWQPIQLLDLVEYTDHGLFSDIAPFGTLSNGTWSFDAYNSSHSADTRTFIANTLHPRVWAYYVYYDFISLEYRPSTCIIYA